MPTGALRGAVLAAALVLGFLVMGKAFPGANAGLETAPVQETPVETVAPPPAEVPEVVEPVPSEAQVEGVTLQVLNGTNESGLAASMAEDLEELGYEISSVGNAARTYDVTTLFFREDSEAEAEHLAATVFPGASLEPAENNLNPDIQITVVIGQDQV